jgi:hypothetical protein
LAFVVGLPVTVAVIFVLVLYIFLSPFQCEVSFARGHAFYKATGIHSSGFRSSYVKPQRAVQRGLEVDVRNNIRGFRITFQNEGDAALFVGWCEESGVPTVSLT